MIRKRVIILIIILCLSGTIFFTGCENENNTLNVYNWGDYIDKTVLKEFEKKYNIKVNYEEFATNEDMYLKIKNGGGDYDVTIASDYMITKMIKENLLEKIDMNNIQNYKYINKNFKNLAFDSNNEYSVPYMWGTLGIIYNTKIIREDLNSWNVLWDSKYKDEIIMLDSQRDTIGIALKRLGFSLNSKNKDELKKAKDELIAQKPLAHAYMEDAIKDMIVDEEGAIATVWSGDAITMMERNENLKYVVPIEGSNIWFDNMVIPKGSKHKKEAELFINFMTSAEVSKKNTEYIGYSTPNEVTKQMLPEEIKNDKVAYPDEILIKKCEGFLDLGDFTKEYDRVWTDIKAQ